MSGLRAKLLIIVGILILAGAAWAETYKWVDKDGTVHFTDNPYELPEPQRSKVLKQLEKQRKQKAPPAQTDDPEPDDRPTRAKSYTGDKDKGRDAVKRTRASGERLPGGPAVAPLGPEAKERWKARAAQARKNFQDLRAKCQKLERDRDQGNRQHLLFGRPGALAKSSEAAMEIPKCKEKLEKARRYLQEELPEKARRAGVPRRWLD